MLTPITPDAAVKTRFQLAQRQQQTGLRNAIRQMMRQQQLDGPDDDTKDDNADDTKDEDKTGEDGDDKDKDADKGKDGKKPDPDDDKPAFTQKDLDRIAAQVRKDVTASFQKKADKEKQDSASAALKEKGEFKTLYEQEQQKSADLEKQIETLQLSGLKKDIAAEFKLPPKLAARLQGSTEDELRADAADLAKEVKTVKPGTEHGDRRQGALTEEQVREAERKNIVSKSAGRYSRM